MPKLRDSVKGKAEVEAKNKEKKGIRLILTKIAVFFLTKLLPIFVAVVFLYEMFHWVLDIIDSANNAEMLYKTFGIDQENGSLAELITIAGNEKDGYYLAYRQGVDERLDELVEEYDAAGYHYMTKDILERMIESELFTQYPNLGGKIGHESDVEIGEKITTGGDMGELCWPTEPDQKTVSSQFGLRDQPAPGASTNHGGIDIAIPEGTNIYACADGTVTVSQYSDSAGNFITIDHGNGYESLYMHNSELLVNVGDTVKKGDLIAHSGNTGITSGPHLHFQIEENGTKVDPLGFSYNNGMGNGDSSMGTTSDGDTEQETDGQDGEGNKEEKKENIMDIPKMYQNDGTGVRFPTHTTSTFPGCGCGPACIAMIMSYLTGEDVSFQEVVDWCDAPEQNGKYFNGKGSNGPIFAASAEHWNVGEVTKTDDADLVVESLLDGKPVVSHQRGGIFANNEHFIVLTGVDADGRIYVNNPNRDTAQDENYDMTSQIDATNLVYYIYENGTPASKTSEPRLILANDTGEGKEGFQGAIRIRRVMPNKSIGAMVNVGSGDTSVVVNGSLGIKEEIPDDVKEKMEGVSMQHLSGIDYDELSYLTIPYYDFSGNIQQGHMIVNAKLADEVLLIFQELYNIKYPIERMEIIDNFSGTENLTGDKLDFASIEENNTSSFNDRQAVTTSGTVNQLSLHATGAAIDINPQINPYINSDGSCAHENAKKYATGRDTQEGWSDVEKAACITEDSRIYEIFTKYGWTWLGNSDNTGDTQHFEKRDLSDVKTIEDSLKDKEEEKDKEEDNETNTSDESNQAGGNSTGSVPEDIDNEDKQKKVEDYINNNATSGQWSVYAKDLNSGNDMISINANDKKQSASLIKLFIMATAYDEIEKGNLVSSEVESDIHQMIIVSDNNAANRMIDRLGFSKINEYIRNNGYSNTEINRKMLASADNGDNYTSTRDVARLLEKIYNKNCVSSSASEQMMYHLKAQTLKEKIPAGVPSGVETASKTGELSTVENDAAIVFKDGQPYILVVMSSGLSDTAKARSDIVQISKIAYGDGSVGSSSNDEVTTTINSKVFDLKFIPEEDFNKMISEENEEVLKYFTLDSKWNLITAKWNYSNITGLTFIKNSPINYKNALKKYTTPMEYLMNFQIDIKDKNFYMDFTDIILDSEFIIAVQDNVTTTETTTDTSIVYNDGEQGESSSEVVINEIVSDKIEVTYVDTWFVKFSKESSYHVSDMQGSQGSLTGEEGEYLGEFKTTVYCAGCNSPPGTPITASGISATPNHTIAVHTEYYNGQVLGGKMAKGSQVIINGQVYTVEDTGDLSRNQPDNWIDIYTETPCENHLSLDSGQGTVSVYTAKSVTSSNNENEDKESDSSALVDVVVDVPGTVTENVSVSTSSEPGPIKNVTDENGYHYVGSTKYIVTTRHSIAYKYVTGDSEITGNEEKFLKLFEDNDEAMSQLKPKWLITITERGEKTKPFLDLTKYLLYKLTGYDYGVTEFDFSIYEPGDFSSTSKGGGFEQFVRWLHQWEGINGSISPDGTKYIIGTDGYGHPTVGYGIDIINGGFADRFKAAGYSIEVGAEVDKEFVDNLEKEELNKALEVVESKCAGLDLTQYQKYALVSRIFNCGESGAFTVRNGKDFIAAYTAYWDQDRDLEYKVPANDAMFSHPLYANYMYLPNTAKGSGFSQGLENRRKAEWLLFKTGYYDRIDEYYEEGGGNIVQTAKTVHDYISSSGYYYSLNDDLPDNVKEVRNTRAVCCATFVSWTLYEAGYEWMLDCPNINYCGTLLPFLESHGGEKIMNPTMDTLQAGDIVFYGSSGEAHTDIYVGDGLWYNCGNDATVQKVEPYAKGLRSDVYCIIRFE